MKWNEQSSSSKGYGIPTVIALDWGGERAAAPWDHDGAITPWLYLV